jgi:HK97 family phage major capsid protein
MTSAQLKELVNTRREKLDRCKKIIDPAYDAKRELTESEFHEYRALLSEIEGMNVQLRDGEDKLLDDADYREMTERAGALLKPLAAGGHWVSGGAAIASGPFLTRSQHVAEAPAFQDVHGGNLDPGRAIRGAITGNWEGADAERRAMAEGVGSTGGFLLSPSMSGILVDLARNQSVCIQAGALTALMDTGEMVIGRQVTDPTAAWIPEGGTITPSDITFDKVTLRATVLAAMCKVSIQLATDARNIDSLIRNALSGAIGAELDRAALMGTGVEQPRGVFYTPDVQTYSLGTNGASIANFDAFSYASQYVQDANGIPNGVVMSPRTAGAIDRLKEAQTNAPLQAPASYTALTKYVTKQVPDTLTQGTSKVASAAIVGDYSQIVMGLAPSEGGLRGIRIDVSRDIAFNTMELMIRAYIRADVAVLRPRWFTVIKGILA